MPFDGKALGELIVQQVREYVGRAIGPLTERVAKIEEREPVVGPQGEPGIPGKDGAPGTPGDAGRDGKDADMDVVKAFISEAVATLPKAKDGADGKDGKDGAPGVNGKDADMESVKAFIAESVAALPKAKDGIDGKDGAPGVNGKDAEPVHPDTVKAMVLELVSKAVADLPKAQDGRDAMSLEPLPGIDETKSYPRGTYAEYRGGMIRALRNTDPITESLEASGWSVCMNGVAEESETISEDGRTTTRSTVYTNGQRFDREYKSGAILDRGVFKQGTVYEKGDCTTWAGSAWVAQRQTEAKPGTNGDWRLAVKCGRDGKDGK